MGAQDAYRLVHLAPYLAAGYRIDRLLEAFITTSREFTPDHTQLKIYLDIAMPLFPKLESLLESLEPRGYPAVHHSKAYRAAYKPAYRVVLKRLF
jgi:hypothetical protein